MKLNGRFGLALAVSLAGFLAFGGTGYAAEQSEAEEMMKKEEAQLKAAAAARAKDSAWKAATTEVRLIQIGDPKKPGALRNYCLNKEGNILACFAPTDGAKPAIRVYSPEGKLLKTLPLEIKPTAITTGKDGSIFVAGESRLLKLDPSGKVLASITSPAAKEKIIINKEMEDMLKENAAQTKRPYKTELAEMTAALEKRRSDVTGVAVTGQDVFMAVPSPTDFTFRVYRFNQELGAPALVVQKLRGCCGQMDIQAHDGKMWIPHNARHAIENLDRDGKQLAKFGKAGKVKPSDFGGCCEPKCMRVLANGDILAAESGPPTCIKRFSASGKFKEVVAVVDDTKGDCVRVTVEMSPDGRNYYMLDTTRDAIRVFAAKR